MKIVELMLIHGCTTSVINAACNSASSASAKHRRGVELNTCVRPDTRTQCRTARAKARMKMRRKNVKEKESSKLLRGAPNAGRRGDRLLSGKTENL